MSDGSISGPPLAIAANASVKFPQLPTRNSQPKGSFVKAEFKLLLPFDFLLLHWLFIHRFKVTGSCKCVGEISPDSQHPTPNSKAHSLRPY
jgi:hypothetical protein